jgi:hypothetical protein
MKDMFTKDWIITESIEIVSQYDPGVLTLRSLHYQLVSRGMTNDLQHYKRVVVAMISARWDGFINFDTFSDLDRGMVGVTASDATILEDEVDNAKAQIHGWMTQFRKNRWENQPICPEIFIEKKALQGVFQDLCRKWDVALGACKGYPSLTFLHETYNRIKEVESMGQTPIILYFGDYDPSGEDIPRSIGENLYKFGISVEVRRIALMEDQVIEWNLPPAPAKVTDSRSAKWDGLGQVELDAVRPEKLMELLNSAIEDVFDTDLYDDLIEQENRERLEYQKTLKDYVGTL